MRNIDYQEFLEKYGTTFIGIETDDCITFCGSPNNFRDLCLKNDHVNEKLVHLFILDSTCKIFWEYSDYYFINKSVPKITNSWKFYQLIDDYDSISQNKVITDSLKSVNSNEMFLHYASSLQFKIEHINIENIFNKCFNLGKNTYKNKINYDHYIFYTIWRLYKKIDKSFKKKFIYTMFEIGLKNSRYDFVKYENNKRYYYIENKQVLNKFSSDTHYEIVDLGIKHKYIVLNPNCNFDSDSSSSERKKKYKKVKKEKKEKRPNKNKKTKEIVTDIFDDPDKEEDNTNIIDDILLNPDFLNVTRNNLLKKICGEIMEALSNNFYYEKKIKDMTQNVFNILKNKFAETKFKDIYIFEIIDDYIIIKFR